MTKEYFSQLLEGNNGIKITNDLVIYNDFELYNYRTEQSKNYNSLDELLNDKLHVAFLSKDLFFRIEENEIFEDFSSGFSITPPILLNDYKNIKIYSIFISLVS